MSVEEPPAPDRKESPGLTLNLSSNNPFRRPSPGAIPSPALPSPRSAASAGTNTGRPVSRNPFLAEFERELAGQPPLKPPFQKSVEPDELRKSDIDGMDAKELFNRLTLRDEGPPPGAPVTRAAPRPEANSSHRPSRSEDEPQRRPPPGSRPPPKNIRLGEGDNVTGSDRKEDNKPRRNSESSVADRPPMSEEERRRRERRRREHEARRREAGERHDGSQTRDDKDRSKHRPSRHRRPHGIDLIDKLDVTGIYGAGLFHHDGPFDACNPHRNRKRDHRAPMQAFPANSANMAMGGSGPVNSGIDLEKVHGTGVEGYQDYGTGYSSYVKKPESQRATAAFDPYSRVEPVHGEESIGLGTSTFLDGAPASRKAIERRESETEQQMAANGGLSRKKSLAQRIRGMSQARPRYADGSMRSPEARFSGPTSPDGSLQPLPNKIPATTSIRQTQSAGGPTKAYQTERNPFDNLYDEEYDKKGASIKAAEAEKEKDYGPVGRERALSSPRSGFGPESSNAADNSPEQPPKSSGGGFLDRVKSLKGRRPRRPS